MIRPGLAKNPLRPLADALARQLGISRSEHRDESENGDEDGVARLNAVYADLPSGVPPALRRAQAKSISASESRSPEDVH